MSISFDFNNVFCTSVGEHGISEEQFELVASALTGVHDILTNERESMAWRKLPFSQDHILSEIEAAAAEVNRRFDAFVVFGIGGSALGAKTLFNALKHNKYNELPPDKRGVRFYVCDNVDPDEFRALLDVIDVKRTAFNIVTKSGNTVETLSQFMIVLDMLNHELGGEVKNNLFLTTDAKRGTLRKVADRHGFKTFTVPEGVGGRYSVFCPVGLFPAAVLNIDIKTLLLGAAEMDTLCSKAGALSNPAYLYALSHVCAMRNGANVSVMMPYAAALAGLSEWYAQLWAESLGKKVNRYGAAVHSGQTPVRALGVTDQHSQIQLYTEGPFDKIITFIRVENFCAHIGIPSVSADMQDISYLSGHTLNELISSEMLATEHSLTKAGKMNIRITLDRIDEYNLGALMYFFEMATAATGELLGVNAFDQPGVEEGKTATVALMGKEGYGEKAEEIITAQQKDSKYLLKM